MVERAQPGSPSTGRCSETASRRARTRSRSSRTRDRARRAGARAGRAASCRRARRRRPRTRALFRAILAAAARPTAEACGGFDWEDGAFDRVYGELEHSLYGTRRRTRALAPLVGLSVGVPIDARRAGSGSRDDRRRDLLTVAGGARAASVRLRPEPERTCVLALERELPGGESRRPTPRPSWPMPSPRSGSPPARRSPRGRSSSSGSTGTRSGSGRCSGSPRPSRRESRPGSIPGGGSWPADLLERLAETEGDAGLGEALERWELALFESEPLRSERLREALAALLGGADGLWAAAMRAAMLIGETSRSARRLDRRAPRARARRARAIRTRPNAAAGLRRGDPARGSRRLIAALDDALLGLRPGRRDISRACAA